MCGIVGVFNSTRSAAQAYKALEKIQHRGSSNFELKTFTHCALGANRLPIVDRSFGVQPQSNQDGTIFAALNGEIFNHKDLRAALKRLGHIFKTESDTEVLSNLYERYGTEMIRHLDSEMYAFIIYDARNNSVFAARDPLGVKPLFYAKTDKNELYFASELKQLAAFDDIREIFEFPAGHYFFKGKFKRYFSIKEKKTPLSELEAIRLLEKNLVNAVKKRVDTDLPMGVFLSGGVDSSLVMEIAVRFHPNVTALILGYEGSSDYEHAVRLCKERGYKYHIITPHMDYAQELDELLYYVESYEPLVVRQAFANWICSREAQRLGLSIVLVGEGADELFAGYNEFSALPDSKINKGCRLLTENLAQGHLKRVDRAGMRFTVEVRCPFLDTEVIQTAFQIPGYLKIKRQEHRITTKYILRRVAEKFLPPYIVWRYKMPFANGAGMNVGYNFKSGDGDIAALAKKRDFELDNLAIRKFRLETPEEKYYFKKYRSFSFCKLTGSSRRLIVKDTLHTLHKSVKHRLVVAEFDKLALYFPVYFASHKKYFGLHNLDVDFIATGGDDNTYSTLANNSAQIGLSDPLFAMFETPHNQEQKGEIIGELVKSAPLVAVAINPNIQITNIKDFSKYKVGTFQKFSTTHTVARSLLPGTDLQAFAYKDVMNGLIGRKIDIAIVLAEYALDLKARGGRIVFEFRELLPRYLFSGFTTSGNLEPRHAKKLSSFTSAIRESFKALLKNEEEALSVFTKIFPDLENAGEIVDYYKQFWVSSLKVTHADYLKSHSLWKKNYPDVLKSHEPYFKRHTAADALLDIINNRKFRREYPFLEDVLKLKLENKESLHLTGFWGAANKNKANQRDINTIEHLLSLLSKIKDKYESGVHVTFILADMHAANNGYSADNYIPYLKNIGHELTSRGCAVIYLSELWSKWGLTLEIIDQALAAKKPHWWNSVYIGKYLESRSSRNFAGEDKKLGAQKYFIMRALEKTHLEKDFRDSIFFVYGDSMAQQIYPKLPTLYLWTEKASCGNCPWFSLS